MEQDIKIFEHKRILITGGGGYLGSKLAERLCQTKNTLYLLDIKFNQISSTLISKNINVLKVIEDLTDFESLKLKCSEIKPDIIFHFAAILNRTRDFNNFNLLNEINVKGTLNLLESIKDVNYETFIYGSTSEVYGTTNKSPFNENFLPNPASPYSLTKLMAELLVQNFSTIYNKPYSILRLFNFYGPDMPEDFFLSQLESAIDRNEEFKMTGGEQTRDYLHVDVMCEYITKLANSPLINGELVNVCSGIGTQLKALATKIAEQKNKAHLLNIGALEYRKNEIWEMVGDNSKLKALLLDHSKQAMNS